MNSTQYSYLMFALIVLLLVSYTKKILEEPKQPEPESEPEILLLEPRTSHTAMWYMLVKKGNEIAASSIADPVAKENPENLENSEKDLHV